MRKHVILLFLVLTIQVSAQERSVRVGLSSGYDFFCQHKLKSLNKSVIQLMPFEVNTIDDFKPHFNFNVYTQYMLSEKLYLGPEYAYHYSGSRLGIKDYSGYFSYDQYLRVHQVGIKFNYKVIPLKRSAINFEMSTGAGFSNWKTEYYLEIGENGEYSEEFENEYKGFSWYIIPAVQYQFHLSSRLSAAWTVSYSFDLMKKYNIESHIGNKKTYTVDMTPCWSGFNLLLGIGYILPILKR